MRRAWRCSTRSSSARAGVALHFQTSRPERNCIATRASRCRRRRCRGARAADAILLGAMGLPAVRYPDGTEVAPQLDFRERFQLYAGVRPIRVLRGRAHAARRSARARRSIASSSASRRKGLFAARKLSRREGRRGLDTMRISRVVSERLFDVRVRARAPAPRAGTAGAVA